MCATPRSFSSISFRQTRIVFVLGDITDVSLDFMCVTVDRFVSRHMYARDEMKSFSCVCDTIVVCELSFLLFWVCVCVCLDLQPI